MTLLRAVDVSVAYGSRVLFDDLEFVIEPGERVGLLGANGSGKSTLLRILAGVLKADSGTLQIQRNTKVTYLPQEPEFPAGATVESELTIAQAELRDAIDAHAALITELENGRSDEKAMLKLEQLSAEVERQGGWDTAYQARRLLDRLGVRDWDRPVAELSGGLKKRVAIARALLTRPQLLLLDEPTNHLDADTVEWLEEALDERDGGLILVTHDRYFLNGLVDRIVEIDHMGQLTSYPGNYETYLEQKWVKQSESETQQHKRNRWIAQEVAWLRKGVEARRTKSKARIDRARKLLSERGFRRPDVAEFRQPHAPRLSQTVIEAHKLYKSFDGRSVFQNVELILQPGERIGLLGPNGAGKTTLLKVLLKELEPDSGEVKHGPKNRIAYFDQQRMQLDPDDTVFEAAGGEEWVSLGEKKVRLGDYLDDLLFPVPMQRQKVSALSGGERNRLLLAKLFLTGANVLVLDEPTNDLDIETLNALEGLLLEFSGSVLIVTHDRYFLDKVATALLVFDGKGNVVRYEGNYDTYRRLSSRNVPTTTGAKVKTVAVDSKQDKKPVRLSYKEQRELDGMEAAIAELEEKKKQLEERLEDPTVFSVPSEASRITGELETTVKKTERLYARWQELQLMVEQLGVKA